MKQQQQNTLSNDTLNKSQKMIQLYESGMEIKDIANLMGVRYNFVYNVISNYTIKNDLQIRTHQNTDTLKSKIIDLHKKGMSKIEISKELKTNYNYVFNTVKQYTNTTK